jgi:hypothetical protein
MRKIFFVVASGGHDTEIHYNDTIEHKRSLSEVSKFLKQAEISSVEGIYKGRDFSAWGATPGVASIRNWEIMEPGDYAMIYKGGKIVFAAEIGYKLHNKELAEYFWKKDSNGKTWEYMYFMINDVSVDVKIEDLNNYFGYSESYRPRGFGPVQQEKTDKILSLYGDLLSILQKIESGEGIEKIDLERKERFKEAKELLGSQIERATTEHDEMQWRLIRLGNKSSFDVWVPANDRNKSYKGDNFSRHVIKDFQETLDVPQYIKNIDTVWKLGHSIKSAFEIEHSTSVYSGILRLSDLKALAPNSNYPMFIVANRERRNKVFNELKRPTFSNDYLKLDEAIKFLSYDKVRELDEKHKDDLSFDTAWLSDSAESVI